MAALFVTLILDGKEEFKNVPKFIKPKVKQMLIDVGAEELAVE